MNRFVAARKFAKRLVEKRKLTPPVDVRKIFEDMNIEIEEKENQYGIEAYSYLNSNVKVVINTEITFAPRIRFTLAHELGHIFIPWHNGDTKCIAGDNYVYVDGKRLLDTQELEANMFASELLMPTEWVKECITNLDEKGFVALVEYIKTKAYTSTLACFFALQNAYSSGNVFYVMKENEEFWRKFISQNTCTTKLYYEIEDTFKILDLICEKKEVCNISQYNIVYYKLVECPSYNQINECYASKHGILLDTLYSLTNGFPIKSLHFIDYIFSSLPVKYMAFILLNNKIIKRIYSEDSPLKSFYYLSDYDRLTKLAAINGIIYEYVTLNEDYRLLYIREKIFKIPKCKICEPNLLLKRIVNELYFGDEASSRLKSINGILSGINSLNKNASRDQLYNLIKYRFIVDNKFEDFYLHPNFEDYIVNKVDRMISMRK